jgi:polo-like kinase 1
LLEYCRNYTLKDLSKRRKRLTEFEVRVYIGQIVKAMIYIHQQGVIHRDLKLGNILINEQMDAKICDFGLSTKIKNEGDSKKTICGTPNYIAPEILEEQGHSYEVDIWSIGVIMYALLFGKPPFEDNTVEQTYENIKNNRYIFPPNIPVSLDAKDLINRILVMDPVKRLSLEEILEHRFMQIP